MGATVRNASSYMERLKMNEEREKLARAVMGKISSDMLEKKQLQNVSAIML
ncbi:hypothetical protein HanRHA438_Chr07g0306421 [Helianthus annuus]|uniref:Uncharacterized protein n=1 Tax=Helianthus annuus TaxID=4232 RepID=A0A9K3IKV5_HELAN|nr:hypothetical protein HanXRQr2_Chr07g0296061 [Helianthus annuus]KAJ0550278.1 hypothetical protein HanHA300_Chr07g0243601 [Helianthus annuus]KAJ0563231.1 hypothetical protein HanHA89_Chr07g0260771 [Helianthus annuus]KAJ0728587.1 hypothetical protein HanLR1_Chr07g0243321 [Helianthus annuus]KAJ0731340.1 hypothetical protein HanOQP8_Chr07g0250841 [Helianthus annuus]